MISGRRVTLPSGQAVTVVDQPAGFTFVLEGTDAELMAPDVLYLAEIIRTDPRFSANAVTGGSSSGSAAAKGEEYAPFELRIASSPPDLTKGGGTEVCGACLKPRPRTSLECPMFMARHGRGPLATTEQIEAWERWCREQPRTAVCSHPCPLVCESEHCGADAHPAPTLTKGGGRPVLKTGAEVDIAVEPGAFPMTWVRAEVITVGPVAFRYEAGKLRGDMRYSEQGHAWRFPPDTSKGGGWEHAEHEVYPAPTLAPTLTDHMSKLASEALIAAMEDEARDEIGRLRRALRAIAVAPAVAAGKVPR